MNAEDRESSDYKIDNDNDIVSNFELKDPKARMMTVSNSSSDINSTINSKSKKTKDEGGSRAKEAQGSKAEEETGG